MAELTKTELAVVRLKESVERDGAIDVGRGVEKHMGVSERTFRRVLMALRKQGYRVHLVRVSQLNGPKVLLRILSLPEVTQEEIYRRFSSRSEA